MPKVLLVLLDGMRFDYLNRTDTPFLHGCLKDATVIERLKKESVFCERSEIYTGENASVTGNYAAFTYDPALSPYRRVLRGGAHLKAADFVGYQLPKAVGGSAGRVLYRVHKRIRRLVQRTVPQIIRSPVFALNDIPWTMLRSFRLTEDLVPAEDPEAFSVTTIFDTLRRRGGRWLNLFEDLRLDPGENSAGRLDRLVEAFSDPVDLYLYATSEPDAIGHRDGTSRLARAAIVKETDRLVKRIHQAFVSANPEGVAVYFSPHGMTDVTQLFDAESRLLSHLARRGTRIPEDIVYFADSTMIRLWGVDAREISEELNTGEWLDFGAWVTDETATEFNLPSPAEGREVIWWADPGVCIFPDFFRRYEPPKGMHGYRMDDQNMDGFAIITGGHIQPGRIDSRPLRSLKATVESLLEGGLEQKAGGEHG